MGFLRCNLAAQRPDRLPASACDGLPATKGVLSQGSCYFFGWPGAIGRFGNAGVGILNGPGTVVWNSGLAKNFHFTEQTKLRLESTFTNVLNHPNFGAFETRVNRSSFGTISSLQNTEGAGARTIQLGVRLEF